MIGRRTFVQMGLAGGFVSSIPVRSHAAEAPFAPPVRQGDFAAAAKILQVEVDAQPLDRKTRLALGKLQFGSGDFVTASQTFETIERRGGVKDDFVIADVGGVLTLGADELTTSGEFSDSAAWLYLSLLRQGKDSKLAAGAPESIRSVLLGTLSIPDYVAIRKKWLTNVLDELERRYGKAQGVTAMVDSAKRQMEASLTCVANVALAEQFLGRSNKDKARAAFTVAIKTSADQLIDFHIAKAEFARLG